MISTLPNCPLYHPLSISSIMSVRFSRGKRGNDKDPIKCFNVSFSWVLMTHNRDIVRNIFLKLQMLEHANQEKTDKSYDSFVIYRLLNIFAYFHIAYSLHTSTHFSGNTICLYTWECVACREVVMLRNQRNRSNSINKSLFLWNILYFICDDSIVRTFLIRAHSSAIFWYNHIIFILTSFSIVSYLHRFVRQLTCAVCHEDTKMQRCSTSGTSYTNFYRRSFIFWNCTDDFSVIQKLKAFQ